MPDDRSLFRDLIEANEAYAAQFRLAELQAGAARGLAVVTCIDARLEPGAMLGLDPGDAAIFRNAGARVTDSVLHSLVLARYLLGVDRVVIVAHTDCRVAATSEDELRNAVRRAGGTDTSDIPLPVTTDQDSALRADVELVRTSRHLAGLPVAGLVYDVRTGRLEQRC
jgi:carbonic anhydrase